MQVGSIFLGKYKIIKRLGKGGMGTVYLAKNESLGNYLAIKKNRKSSFKNRYKNRTKNINRIKSPINSKDI